MLLWQSAKPWRSLSACSSVNSKRQHWMEAIGYFHVLRKDPPVRMGEVAGRNPYPSFTCEETPPPHTHLISTGNRSTISQYVDSHHHWYRYEGESKSFRNESITKYTLITINTRWEATQRVMVANLIRPTHKLGDTTAPSSRELYHLQFSLQEASPETFGYAIV
jgi:hypothetical protein